MELSEKEVYELAKSKGVDYNYYGYWQEQYTKMIISLSNNLEVFANNQKESLLLDIGTGCGVNLKGFKETKTFNKYIGIDKNNYMIELGKETHKFTDEELITLDITKDLLPVEDETVFLLHSSQTLDRIDPESIDDVLDEFKRVLHPEGTIIININAIKPGQNKEENSNLQTIYWWKSRINKYFDQMDNDINKRFKKEKHSPDSSERTFYDYYNKSWNFFQASK